LHAIMPQRMRDYDNTLSVTTIFTAAASASRYQQHRYTGVLYVQVYYYRLQQLYRCTVRTGVLLPSPAANVQVYYYRLQQLSMVVQGLDVVLECADNVHNVLSWVNSTLKPTVHRPPEPTQHPQHKPTSQCLTASVTTVK